MCGWHGRKQCSGVLTYVHGSSCCACTPCSMQAKMFMGEMKPLHGTAPQTQNQPGHYPAHNTAHTGAATTHTHTHTHTHTGPDAQKSIPTLQLLRRHVLRCVCVCMSSQVHWCWSWLPHVNSHVRSRCRRSALASVLASTVCE